MGNTVRFVGDAALTLWLDAPPGPQTTARLAWIAQALRAQAQGVVDVAAAFASLTVHLDPRRADMAALESRLLTLADAAPDDPPQGRLWRVPICVDPAFGPDQDDVAAQTGLDRDAVIALLLGCRPHVLSIGFLPGFPFCGPAPAPLALKRKATPRTRVPPGSVAVANGFIGIYPWVSPGGWHILAATGLPLFDAGRDQPVLLAPGDRLAFEAVDADAHAALLAGPRDPARFLIDDGAAA